MARLYRTYLFRDKDPTIDAIRTCVQDEKLKIHSVHQISGVAAATINNWFNGGTRQPQNSTLTAVSSALGYVRHDRLNRDGTVTVAFEKQREYDWRKEIDKQADWLLKQNKPKKKRRRAKKKANGHG